MRHFWRTQTCKHPAARQPPHLEQWLQAVFNLGGRGLHGKECQEWLLPVGHEHRPQSVFQPFSPTRKQQKGLSEQGLL